MFKVAKSKYMLLTQERKGTSFSDSALIILQIFCFTALAVFIFTLIVMRNEPTRDPMRASITNITIWKNEKKYMNLKKLHIYFERTVCLEIHKLGPCSRHFFILKKVQLNNPSCSFCTWTTKLWHLLSRVYSFLKTSTSEQTSSLNLLSCN